MAQNFISRQRSLIFFFKQLSSMSTFQKWLNHPAGPKTIFFWSPMCKWGLVIAGLGDINRPAENLSLPQSVSLTATGIIWSRYSTQITPINYNLMSVNIFVAATGIYQLYRIYNHRKTHPAEARPSVAQANK